MDQPASFGVVRGEIRGFKCELVEMNGFQRIVAQTFLSRSHDAT